MVDVGCDDSFWWRKCVTKSVSILVVVDVGCDEPKPTHQHHELFVSILVVVDVGCDDGYVLLSVLRV